MSGEARREFVRAHAADKSASEMGEMVGASRNAIIGIAHRAKPKIELIAGRAHAGHRLGWQPHQRVEKRPPEPKAKPIPTTQPLPVFEPPPADITEPLTNLLGLGSQTSGVCRFPMFTDKELVDTTSPSELPFCGRDCAEGSLYCPDHHRRVYAGFPSKTRLRE